MGLRDSRKMAGNVWEVKVADENPKYWSEYSNLQRVKHELIRNYLNGWLPKLGSWARRVVYFDTHAGRGKHSSGELGSPLVALKTLLEHSARDRLLEKSEFKFFFIERDDANLGALKRELKPLEPLPTGVSARCNAGDCFKLLDSLATHFENAPTRIAPSFFFVDPYGFKVPGALLRRIMQFERVELFVNVIWRELNMLMGNARRQAGARSTMNEIFDGDRWMSVAEEEDFDRRAELTVNLYKELTGATWATYITMRGNNDAARYLLIHLTNHDAGRDLMKDCIWKVCPEGGFYARKKDDPEQQFLIQREPDLSPLRNWVWLQLDGTPLPWKELHARLRAEVWREPQLNEIVREMRKAGEIESLDPSVRFTPSNNPTLSLSGSDEAE